MSKSLGQSMMGGRASHASTVAMLLWISVSIHHFIPASAGRADKPQVPATQNQSSAGQANLPQVSVPGGMNSEGKDTVPMGESDFFIKSGTQSLTQQEGVIAEDVQEVNDAPASSSLGARIQKHMPPVNGEDAFSLLEDLSVNSSKSGEHSTKSKVAAHVDFHDVAAVSTEGFCPEFKFGGGEGNNVAIKQLGNKLIMVKVFYADHLPSGGGVFFEDLPDIYIKFSVDDAKAQTRFVKNSYTPMFGDTCYFEYAGHPNLKMTLWEKNTLGDKKVGFLGLTEEAGYEMGPPFWKNCNTPSVDKLTGQPVTYKEECAKHFKVFKDGKNVIGKDGKPTTVTMAFKVVDPLKKSNFGMPKEEAEVEFEAAESSSLSQANHTLTSETSGHDWDGFCPNFKIGGKMPLNIPAPEKLMRFEVVKVTDVPVRTKNLIERGWGWMSSDKVSPYVYFGAEKHWGQTSTRGATGDEENPLFKDGCYFPFSGNTDLQVKLYDYNKAANDELLGQATLRMDADAMEDCKNEENGIVTKGECYVKFPLMIQKGDEWVKAMSNENGAKQTEVYVALKFVQAYPRANLMVDYSLGM